MRRGSARNALALWLAFALVGSQWLGLHHGIVHSGVFGQQVVAVAGSPGGSSAGSEGRDDWPGHHSCAAFDAATLASGAPSAIHIDLGCTLANTHPDAVDPEFYLPLFAALFNSRAPPHSLPA